VKNRHNQLKYQRVEAEIRQLAKTLPIGAKLLSERELAIACSCNFLTVRKALKRLVDDGTVVRRIGSGTFIARHPDQSPVHSRKANRIGILVYQGGNAYAYRVVQGIAHAGLEEAVELRSGWVRDFGEDAIAQADLLRKEGCVALTLPWFPHEQVEEIRAFAQKSPLPVSLPMVIPGLENNSFQHQAVFEVNAILPTEMICRYYDALGYRRIGLIGPDSANDVILQSKLIAYARFTSRHNLPNLCGLVPPGAAAMDQLAERWKAYQGDLAVIAYDDEYALGFMTAMHKIGLSAPQDYRIVGFNDTEASHYSDPPLTTIRQDFDYIGRWLLKNALALSRSEVCQSMEPPRIRMLVAYTCGGREKIDDRIRTLLPELELRVEGNSRVRVTPPASASDALLKV